jgi:small subunit ribosomal protein S16
MLSGEVVLECFAVTPDGDQLMVRLRFQRMGRRHRPFYRLNAMDQRSARDSRSIEHLGHFDPLQTDASKQYVLKEERIRYWLGVGAQPSRTVADMLRRAGITEAKATKAAAAS